MKDRNNRSGYFLVLFFFFALPQVDCFHLVDCAGVGAGRLADRRDLRPHRPPARHRRGYNRGRGVRNRLEPSDRAGRGADRPWISSRPDDVLALHARGLSRQRRWRPPRPDLHLGRALVHLLRGGDRRPGDRLSPDEGLWSANAFPSERLCAPGHRGARPLGGFGQAATSRDETRLGVSNPTLGAPTGDVAIGADSGLILHLISAPRNPLISSPSIFGAKILTSARAVRPHTVRRLVYLAMLIH